MKHEFLVIIIMIIFQDLNTFIAIPNYGKRRKPFNYTKILEENRNYSAYSNHCPLRIVGGVPAKLHEIPYQVSLRSEVDNYWGSFCGGSLITLEYVMTAAHCLPDEVKPSMVKVFAGLRRGSTKLKEVKKKYWRNVQKFHMHKEYDVNTMINDMAIVELKKKFTESRKIKPIRLHILQLDGEVEENEQCLVAGFGVEEAGRSHPTKGERPWILKMVCVPIVTNDDCAEAYGVDSGSDDDLEDNIDTYILCAGTPGKDSCYGDSGGAIVCRGVQVGIVSWGGSCAEEYPGIYTKIIQYTGPLAADVKFSKTAKIGHFNRFQCVILATFVFCFFC